MSERKTFTDWWTDLMFFGVVVFWLFAAYVVGYQIFVFLKHGVWLPLSVIDGLLYLNPNSISAWLLYPQDWVGLHKLLQKIPLSFALALLGILWGFLATGIGVKFEEFRAELKDRRQRKQE